MYLIRNDLTPRFPRPKPLLFREVWAGVYARAFAVSCALNAPHFRLHLYSLCQSAYNALEKEFSSGKEAPEPEKMAAFFTEADAQKKLFFPAEPDSRYCIFCGEKISATPYIVAFPSVRSSRFPQARALHVPACKHCGPLFSGIDPMLRFSCLKRLPSLYFVRLYLRELYAYAYYHDYLDRMYFLDLQQRRYQHTFDLAGMDINFAFLSVYFRTKGKAPELFLDVAKKQ